MDTKKKEAMDKIRELRDECRQILIDQHHWNNSVRKPDEPPINIDLDGMLKRKYADYESFLAKEEQRAPVPLDADLET
jgi:hypothetical protein